MATIRKWLNEAKADWDTIKIIYQNCGEKNKPPRSISIDKIRSSNFIYLNDIILDLEFDDDYGSAECPRFVAEDINRIYFPQQYDGATRLCFIYKDIYDYLDNETPYPGGG